MADRDGFTLIEVVMVVAIIATLSAIAVPEGMRALERARVNRAVADLRTIEEDLVSYLAAEDDLPFDLATIGRDTVSDPWGRPYRYLKILNNEQQARGKWRKDRFLVPINTDFDLYSSGPDGVSRSPLTARASRDDIIRAANGGYIGPAAGY